MTSPYQKLAEELLASMDATIGILVLVTGTLEDGSAHYAYASIPPGKYPAFKQAEAMGHYDLGEFGSILAHGAGAEPPADVVQQMRERYGASHTFEADVAEMTARLEKAMFAPASSSDA